MFSPAERETVLDAWCDLDRSTALHGGDREAVDPSRSIRAVVVDFARAGGTDEEIYDACATLGRLIAQQGGSPTLASSTIDHTGHAMGAGGAPWLAPARAAVLEGFTHVVLEKARQDSFRSWEFPNCAVVLPGESIAIAAGHPSRDPEHLLEWAARVAKGAALQGVRRAFVGGSDAPRRAIEDALEIIGIAIARG